MISNVKWSLLKGTAFNLSTLELKNPTKDLFSTISQLPLFFFLLEGRGLNIKRKSKFTIQVEFFKKSKIILPETEDNLFHSIRHRTCVLSERIPPLRIFVVVCQLLSSKEEFGTGVDHVFARVDKRLLSCFSLQGAMEQTNHIERKFIRKEVCIDILVFQTKTTQLVSNHKNDLPKSANVRLKVIFTPSKL